MSCVSRHQGHTAWCLPARDRGSGDGGDCGHYTRGRPRVQQRRLDGPLPVLGQVLTLREWAIVVANDPIRTFGRSAMDWFTIEG